jgi:hypothetical protein
MEDCMTRSVRILAAIFGLLAGARANAQQCAGGPAALDACRKGIDLVNFLSPQYAAALAGGNPTMAQSGTLGGLGRFAVAVRSTRVIGDFPNFGEKGFATAGEAPSSYTSASTLIPALSVDITFGVFRGFDVGQTHMGGVDALLSGSYMSELSQSSLDVALEGSNTNFGFGVRVGVIEETPTLPGVAVAYLKRDMPRFTVTGTASQSSGGSTVPGTIVGSSMLVTASSMRLTAGKRFGPVDVTAGVGQDKYQSAANVLGSITAAPPIGVQTASGVAAMDMTRTNVFGGAAFNLAAFKFVGEYGIATGGSAPAATNTFGSSASEARKYFSLAIRIGF